jgi:hypothetical protein
MLSPQLRGFGSVSTASDRQNGAVVAFLENPSGPFNKYFRVQRIEVDGDLPWGPSGTVIVGPKPNRLPSDLTPVSESQIVTGQNEFAVLWRTPIVHAAWISTSGQLLRKPFVVGTTAETWVSTAKRTAIADSGGGGFYVALCTSSSLDLLRFESRTASATWTSSTQPPIVPEAYSIAEDGNGGALLASVGSGGLISVARYNPAGVNLWASAAAANAAIINFGLPLTPAAYLPEPWRLWGGVVAIAPKSTGGAILVNPDWNDRVTLVLPSFDQFGELIGRDVQVSWAPGTQEWPHLTDELEAAPVAGSKPSGSAVDPGTVICVWTSQSGSGGTSISAQKLGCCPRRPVKIIPHVPEMVAPDVPRAYPGTIFVSFPGSSKSERYGLIPLPYLAEIPRVNLPGSLITAGVDAPGWVRLWLGNVPEDVNVDVWAHTGELAAVAKPSTASAQTKNALSGVRTLTFRPSAKLSYLLRFRRPRHSNASSAIPLSIRFEFGLGSGPPPPDTASKVANQGTVGGPVRRRSRATTRSSQKQRRR